MSTATDTNDSTDTENDSELPDIDGEEVETMVIVGGEQSMPNNRREACQAIDEAVVESPYQPTDEIRFRGQTNHQDAMHLWAKSRDTLDPDFDVDEVYRIDVEWPEDDDADARDEDGDLTNDAISQAFDERNERMTDGADALVVVANGARGDYLQDVTGQVSDRDTYDHSVEGAIDTEEAQDLLGM